MLEFARSLLSSWLCILEVLLPLRLFKDGFFVLLEKTKLFQVVELLPGGAFLLVEKGKTEAVDLFYSLRVLLQYSE